MNDPALISPEYAEQCRALAKLEPTWGSSSEKLLEQLPDLAARVRAADYILDYGCGTGALVRAMREANPTAQIDGYDPRNPIEWPHPPALGQCDLIVCTDVLEHVERERVGAVLRDIAALLHRNGLVFFIVSTQPAIAVLPATETLPERNAHITVETASWWRWQMRDAGLAFCQDKLGASSPAGFFGFWRKA